MVKLDVYRTVGNEALCIMGEMLSLDLLANKVHYLY